MRNPAAANVTRVALPITGLAVLAFVLIILLARREPVPDTGPDALDVNQWITRAVETARVTETASPTPLGAAQRSRSRSLAQMGFLALPGFSAQVWAHRGFAYVGSYGTAAGSPAICPARGVRIVALSDPTQPQVVSSVAAISSTSQEDVVVRRIETPHFAGDLLAAGIQACVRTSNAPRGVDLWDVTNPRAPRHLAFWGSGPFGPTGARGVQALHLFQRGARAYLVAAVPYSEVIEGRGDVRIVDVTDPRHPVQVSHWGTLADAVLAPAPGQIFVARGVRANRAGTVAALAYRDAGAVLLDINDPASPRMLGRALYPPGSDGGAHSVSFAQHDSLLLTADEDFSPADGSWGHLRIWNVKNPAAPVEVGRFITRNAATLTPAAPGLFSIRGPFVRNGIAYLAWYSDGIRVVDLATPASPDETAFFVPPPVADPFVFFPTAPLVVGVHVEHELIIVSDINAGLYILRHVP